MLDDETNILVYTCLYPSAESDHVTPIYPKEPVLNIHRAVGTTIIRTLRVNVVFFLQDVIRTIGEVPADSRTAVPKKSVKIIDCGIVGIEKKYELTEAQAASDDDLQIFPTLGTN